jgi:transcriptional regulatory protein LevR
LDLQQRKQFANEVQDLTGNIWMELEDSIYNIQELFYKIVDHKIILNVLNLTKSLNKKIINYRFTHKSFILLCLLINFTSKNDKKQMTYNLYNWQIGSKKEHFIIIELINELEALIPCISKIREYVYLLIIIDIKANSKNLKYNIEHNQVEIIVVSQGTSIASNMLEVAQNILSIQEGFAIDIPVYSDYKIIADSIEKQINEIDIRSDVLLLVDFVSIVALGDIIMHRTGRTVKIITNVSTLMVVEGIKNAYINLLSLEKIGNLIEDINPNTLESYKNTNHEQMILVTCVSGYGTAQKIAEWVSSLNVLKHTDIDTIPIGDYESEMFSDKKILAVIGTVDLGLVNIPYIPLEELVLGTGIAKLIDIIKGDSYNANSIIIDEDIEEITLSALKRLLEFCDAQKLFNILDLTIKNLEKDCEHYSQNIYLRFITHTACMVERLIKNISLVHNKTKSVLKKYENNYLNLKNNLNILEETYGIRIPDEEYAYMLELLNDEN